MFGSTCAREPELKDTGSHFFICKGEVLMISCGLQSTEMLSFRRYIGDNLYLQTLRPESALEFV